MEIKVLMTEKEKKNAKLHNEICTLYKAYRIKYGELVSDTRIFKLIAQKVGFKSHQGVRNIIVKNDLNIKRRNDN